ncbi:UPF0394 inner membrane protein YeeE-like [Lytechinus variegatus]|uniref:UPF0394 inner membrane protein YeeE-like n=1 Tax=Lytechinus variegatus TaxID=7654 RepID=UPI001BB23240|nr:UPF0394 inner membrane protein YeeE-like [Lytechinus variegatus]
MESAPTITMTTGARQRSLKCEPADCDANGNVPFMKSANMTVSPLVKDGEGFTTNGHLIHTGYCENGDSKHPGGRLVNGTASNGSIPHHAVNGETPRKAPPSSSSSTISSSSTKHGFPVSIKLLMTAASGVVFGFAMEKGRVFEPYNIRGQMLFQNFVMLKMFLSAIVASIVWFSILSLLPFTASKFQSARNNLGCRMNSKGMAAAAIGGAMLGIGMALSGACPGAVLIEVGAGVQHAGMTFIGCLVGAVLYGITEEYVNNLIRPSKQITVKKLDEHVGVPYIIFALPVALVIMLALVLIEYLAPWQTELTSPNTSDELTGLIDFISLRSWPPVLAGMLVGCLQLPIVLAVDEPIGGSRGYCTLVSQVIPMSFLERFSPYLKASRTGLKNWWQVLYITSAIGGAAASALSSGTWSSTVGVPPLHALLGGVIMIYGSRLAGGCTSGHGLSGIGSLSILSFIAIPAMFAGGIATAITMTTLGIY